jgi:serine/threonine protein kinase
MLKTGMILQERYHTVRKLGGGGMGTVYLAEDRRLPGRQCALKEMIPQELPAADRSWAVQAFQMEAQMLANLSHPGLTRVTDFFGEKDSWYLVMDFIPGETLEDRIERYPEKRIPLSEAMGIIQQLCDVLNYLHQRNPPVIFRDLKPSNVMVTPQDEVKLIDFGIARFFKKGKKSDTTNLGTPGYAAPEQYGGAGQSDARTDIYSLGVLINQMITGYDPSTAPTPFPLPDSASLLPSVPPHIARVISRATQLQPQLRYGNIAELQRDLFNPTMQPPTQGPPGYGATQVSPTGTQVMPGAGPPPSWSGQPHTSYQQTSPQYQPASGPGYTQIQPQGGQQGPPANIQYTPPEGLTPWPSQSGGAVTYPQTVTAPPAKNRTVLIIAILGIAVVITGICAGAFLFGRNIFDQLFPSPPLTVIETVDDDHQKVIPVPDATDTPTVEPTEEPTPDSDNTATPSLTPEPDQPTPTSTATSTPTGEPQPEITTNYGTLGKSIQNRDLSYTSIGYNNANKAVIVVGSIQGDQPMTRDLVAGLINHYTNFPDSVPNNTQILLIPSINPDGIALGSRYNANSVDLNRNWDTSDWIPNPAVPGYSEGKAGAGGSQPFSEPETKALRNYLNNLKNSGVLLRVFILHSSVRISSGQIYPGGNSALDIASVYANATGYGIEHEWAAYVTSGEAVTWCEENNIQAIDVVLPTSQNPSTIVSGNRNLLEITVDGIRNLAELQ